MLLDPADAALVVQITAGDDHACVRTSDGRGFCWGHNEGPGALGTEGAPENSAAPIEIIATGLTHLDIAGWLACGLDAGGRLRCWGEGRGGMLGDGLEETSARPVQPTGLETGVTGFDTGGGADLTTNDSTCAIQLGQLLCWGANEWGQLGDGTEERALEPRMHAGLPGTPVSVAVGGRHACALLDDGRVYCWGDGRAGQLGDGGVEPSFEPVPVALP